MKRLRYLVIAINLLAAILIVAIGAGAWMLGTESGTGWLVAKLTGRIGPALSIGRVSGTLLDQLRLERIEYRAPGMEIESEALVVSFDLLRLVSGGLAIESLQLSELHYRQTGTAASSGGGSVSAPLPVVIENGVVEGIVIDTAENDLELGRLSFASAWIGEQLTLERFETSLGDISISGQLTLGFDEALAVAGNLSWGGPIGERDYLGNLLLSGRYPELSVEHSLFVPYSITTEGTVWLEDRPRVDLDFTWVDVAAPGDLRAGSSEGSAAVTGPIDRLEFEAGGMLEVVESNLEFAARGVLDGAVVLVERASVTGPEGTLSASGELELDTTQWALEIEAEDLDPRSYLPDWPGRIAVNGGASGRIAPQLAVETRDLELSGTLRERPFEAVLSAVLTGTDRLELRELRVVSGEDRLEARGLVTDSIDLAIELDIAAVESVWADLSGRASARLAVAGTVARPSVQGELDLDDGRYGNVAFRRLGLSGYMVAARDGELDLDLTGEEVTVGRLEVDALRADIAGRLADHSLRADARAAEWSASASARGGLDGRLWAGTVESLQLDQQIVGIWTLSAPSSLTVGPGVVAVERSCLAREATSLCAELNLVGAPEDGVTLSAVDFDVRALQPLLPDVLALEGVYQLSARLVDLGGDPSGTLTVSGGATRVELAPGTEETVTIDLERVDVNAELDAWALGLDLDLRSLDGGRLDVAVAAADLRDENTGILGRVESFWPNLAAVSLISPDLGEVGGTLAIDIEVEGTRAEPQLRGEARWNDGFVEVPQWGLLVDGVEARGTSSDARTLEFAGTGRIADAEVRLEGNTELDPSRRWPTRLTLRGDSLPIVRLPDAEVFVSPALEVDVALPSLTVAGTVHVPRARIEIDELPSQAVRPSSDSVVHGTAEAQEVRPLHTQAVLRVTLGDDVHYSGSNLVTDVSGELQLDYDSRATTSAIGTLSAAGTYNAYGQILDLDRGELLFSGPLENPALDIRAIRRVGEQTVGVELGGTLLAPDVRIFSEPSLSEADALSYLMFGRPLSGTGDEETATLRSAAVALGLQQALPVVQRIGETIGLDELSIESTDVDAGALMAGKYLSPKLYIRYSYGLFNRIGGLLLRFKVNERISIETRSGDQKSMDLLYTVEKE